MEQEIWAATMKARGVYPDPAEFISHLVYDLFSYCSSPVGGIPASILYISLFVLLILLDPVFCRAGVLYCDVFKAGVSQGYT